MKLRINIRHLKVIAVILAVVLVLGTALAAINTWEKGQKPKQALSAFSPYDDVSPRISFNGAWYTPRENIENVLLIGLDKYGDEPTDGYKNNRQSDFLLLLVLDKSAGKCTAININRDTMTDVDILGINGELAGSSYEQLSLAHTYGSGGIDSCENVVAAVERMLYGIEIDHYISMTMNGVALLNDLAGGVTVELMDDLTAFDPELVKGETVTLNGEQAMLYVRSRYGLEDDTNIHRMERQTQYLRALWEALNIQANADTEFTLNAMSVLSEYMVSNFTVNHLSNLSETVGEFGIAEFISPSGQSVKGEEFMEFYPNEDELQTLVADVFYELSE